MDSAAPVSDDGGIGHPHLRDELSLNRPLSQVPSKGAISTAVLVDATGTDDNSRPHRRDEACLEQFGAHERPKDKFDKSALASYAAGAAAGDPDKPNLPYTAYSTQTTKGWVPRRLFFRKSKVLA